VYFCLPQNEKYFGGGNFGGGFGSSTKYIRKKLMFFGNIFYFRVFYLDSASPEPKESSIIMKISFKFAKIEYFHNLHKSVQNNSIPFKYGSLKSPVDQVYARERSRRQIVCFPLSCCELQQVNLL